MKATGIVRRIDDLGRVVIPKEIRRTMRIREGDPLEIYLTEDGCVIFKKYQAFDINDSAVSAIKQALSRERLRFVIYNTDEAIAASSAADKRKPPLEMSNLEDVRQQTLFTPQAGRSTPWLICPILNNGDLYGWVTVEGDSDNGRQAARMAAAFLGNTLDI